MLNQLEALVNEEKWEEARSLIGRLEQEMEPSDRLALLNAVTYMGEEKLPEAYQCITVGIICNPTNYELYLLLGDYYLNKNINQAYLCYEQAYFYCQDREGQKILEENMDFVKELEGFEVRPVSFVVLSHCKAKQRQECLDSIRNHHGENMYELVDVLKPSGDDIVKLLEEKKHLLLKNDIFLLEDDTIVPPNALFWLRMGLYERDTVGAVGPASNCADNNQKIKLTDEAGKDRKGCLKLAESIHIPMPDAYTNKMYLDGFAILVKNCAWREAGAFDFHFPYGNYEVMNYGMTLSQAGYELLFCANAFVYHYGNPDMVWQSYRKQEEQVVSSESCLDALIKKWGINPTYYMHVRTGLVQMITADKDACIRVLEVGCGFGSTLSHIKWVYPNASVYGIELEEQAATLGRYMADIVTGNIETMELPYAAHMFDYIIFGDVLEHLHQPQKTITEMKKYLREGGKVIASIPNLLNASVIAPLLRGRFHYVDAGLLDKTHIHLFTRQEIANMFARAGYQITNWSAVEGYDVSQMEPGDMMLIEKLCQIPGVVSREEFRYYQYYILANVSAP